MPVGTGAGAATARLDAEQVVEQGHDVIVVQVAFLGPDAEGDDRQAAGVGIAEDLDVRVGLPAIQRTAPEALLARLDQVGTDRLLEPDDQPSTDRLDDRRGAALLPSDRIVEIAVADRVDEGHRAAARRRGDAVVDQLAADHQHAGRLRPTDELVRREEDRVLVVGPARGAGDHADRHVRGGPRVVPGRQGAVAVQRAAMRSVSDRMPVTLEAAEKLPIRKGRSAKPTSRASRSARSMWPSGSSPMTTTSAIDSRQGSSLE